MAYQHVMLAMIGAIGVMLALVVLLLSVPHIDQRSDTERAIQRMNDAVGAYERLR